MSIHTQLKWKIALVALSFSWLPLQAMAQQVSPDIVPPNVSPGAIMNYTITNIQRQQREPWLTRPIMPSDYRPYSPDEPLIEYRNMDIQGSIVMPEKAPTIHIVPPQ